MSNSSTLPQGQFVDAKEAAQFFGCTTRHIYRLCERGQLKAIRLGKVWRINRAALLQIAETTPNDPVAE